MDIGEFDRWLTDKHLSGYWMPRKPQPSLAPRLWKWADLYHAAMTAGELVSMERVNMRTVGPVSDGVEGGISATLSCSIQMLLPGERTKLHRALQGETRFVLQGSPGAVFVIEGEPFPMERGDLIVTPHLAWHDHFNGGTEPVIWLDSLDTPLTTALAGFGCWRDLNERPEKTYQDITREQGTTARTLAAARPSWVSRTEAGTPLWFRWGDTERTLTDLEAAGGDPYDGVHLRYTHPLRGGPVLPTFSCEIQLLRPRERTAVHRHNSTAIYQAFQGSGVTVVDEQRLAWEQGDLFIVPAWAWHQHENASGEPAVLYSVTDRPTLSALGLYREEPER